MIRRELYAHPSVEVMMRLACVILIAFVGATRTQTFDADPKWESRNNRVVPEKRPTVVQDFGWADGRIGGTVTRASEPAWYAKRFGPVTLEQKISASGTFSFDKTTAGSGTFFGFFNANQPGGSGRPIGSLGLDFDGEHSGARLAVRLITARNQSCGTFATPFIPGKFRPTPIRNDGTKYAWTLAYDPDAAGGRGRFTFTLTSDAHEPGELETPDMTDAAREEARKRFPSTTTFSVDLPEGYKQQGTTFDRFGMMNMMKPGGVMVVHHDDVAVLDQRDDFASDPKWDGNNNRATYEAKDVVGAHVFGFNAATNHAGGAKPGEAGGSFWRTDEWGYYADQVGPLTFDQPLEARGKITMTVGGPDSDMCLGWFRARDDGAGDAPNSVGDFLGVKIGGPTRVGHYYLPWWTVNEKLRGKAEQGPVMKPGKSSDFAIVYQPDANGGAGAITATLDGESVTLNLKPGQREAVKEARMDHFGLFSIGPGGQVVKVFLDDVSYTVADKRVERFDRDPSWDGFNNRIPPKPGKSVKQDFGYRDGTIGGTIWRSMTPASYAAAIEPKTLNDKLSASGTFAITATAGSSGAFFGFFKAGEADAGRQNSLGFRFAGEGSGARITFQLVTGKNQACGTKVTPWVVDKTKPKGPERKYRPTAIRNDGTRYTWRMDYDPAGNNGDGQMRFTVRSDRAEPDESFEGKTFEVNLPAGYKSHGTTFDRFGLTNSARPGNPMTIHFADVALDGTKFDFSRDPQWIGVGNVASYDRSDDGGAHDFGFSDSRFAGGAAPGEIGGVVWRSGVYGFYADRVGPLSMDQPLEAGGKVILAVGSPDSGVNLGWFNSTERELAPTQAGQFVGVRIGGPTRVGHYFVPAYAPRQTRPPKPTGTREHPASVSVEKGSGPVLTPGKVFDWKLLYQPNANGGAGAVTATLGGESVTLNLKPGDKAKGATLDRFGLFTTNRGGSFVKTYFDDLKYTASTP
jgi:hypothetical protein